MHDQSRYQCMIARLSVHDQPGMEKLDFVVTNVQKCWRKMFKVKRSLFKYSNISLKEDFIKNPWKGRLEHCSTDDTDQYKN